jgi:hypothetical protein
VAEYYDNLDKIQIEKMERKKFLWTPNNQLSQHV